jgi:hypothetical protein
MLAYFPIYGNRARGISSPLINAVANDPPEFTKFPIHAAIIAAASTLVGSIVCRSARNMLTLGATTITEALPPTAQENVKTALIDPG